MDPFVTIATDFYADVEFGLGVSAPKMRPPMKLLGDQVMKSELSVLATASAHFRDVHESITL